jgi:tRNA threonylcarbamoyl adenosine modification protein YeaZ
MDESKLDPKIILALETSSKLCSVALWDKNNKIIGHIDHIGAKVHNEHLLPSIQHLLDENNLSLSDLDGIAIGVGPGSFTGLRIGCAAVQGLALSLEIPIFTCSSLRIMSQDFILKNIKNIKNINTQNNQYIDHENIINAIEYFADAIGPNGMVAGQSMDVNNKDISDINSLNNLHNLKTGKLIQASILLPLILIGIDKTKNKLFKIMEQYAKTLGIAFQIKDDLLDKTSSTQKLGKRVQKDSDMDKITYPEILGIEKCKSQLGKYTQDAINYINQAELLINNKNLNNLKSLATWNLEREN